MIKKKFTKWQWSAASLPEVLIATILILSLFLISGAILQQWARHQVKSDTQALEQRLRKTSYLLQWTENPEAHLPQDDLDWSLKPEAPFIWELQVQDHYGNHLQKKFLNYAKQP